MLERKQHYMDMATKCTAVYRDMPGGGSKRVSGVEEYGDKLVDLAREMEAAVAAYADLTKEIEAAIDAVDDDRDRELLRMRYINGWGLRKIAFKMGYSEDAIWHLHGKALQKIKVPE